MHLLHWDERDRSASHLADVPDHQDHLVGYPQVDRRRAVVQVESQFGEDVVAQVDPGARENEADVAWRFAGRWLSCERSELARFLR